MDISEIRRRNLLLLLERYEQDKDFAAQVGIGTTYLSRLKRPGEREMGGPIARRIEERLKLPYGWMDALHADDGEPVEPSGPPLKVPVLAADEVRLARKLVNNYVPLVDHELHATNLTVQRHTFAMRLEDDSMVGLEDEPRLSPGTLIVVEPDVVAAAGDYVVIAPRATSNEVMLRVLEIRDGTHVARPLNPAYPLVRITKFVSICGVAKEAYFPLC